MHFKNLSLSSVNLFAIPAALFLFSISSLLTAYAQAPSKFANETFTVISRSDRGHVHIHVRGEGDHCWASTSNDHTVAISMGDSMCSSSPQDVPDGVVMFARIMPSKISFRMKGRAYSISDPNTVKTARGLFDPLVKIEAQQSDLGEKQRALGEQQSGLGAKQSQVRVDVPDMSTDFQRVEAEARRLSSRGATQSELGDLQSELGDLQSRIGDLQSKAGDVQSKLGNQQSELGDRQSRLGDQQSALGEQADKLSVGIADKLNSMLAQAVSSGSAKPE